MPEDRIRVAPNTVAYADRVNHKQVERVHFSPAGFFVKSGKEQRLGEATAITIDTDWEIRVRAAAPVLYVGDVRLTESESLGKNRYRF